VVSSLALYQMKQPEGGGESGTGEETRNTYTMLFRKPEGKITRVASV